ncbi:hypothetical protein CRM22_004767 [Opisthorchis felineus]|uniref:DNA replication complex GINS protein PSF2 n=1 Tax=Opisthorchis felineus TaxID=147828 RepID=A0A4S2M0Y6_OPIFE|nr:hypothetical protein CRM22_004767 [Opisthorchis felineus]
MNPAELEFLAEDEPVQIIPRFKLDAIQLLPYSAGPFYPNVPVTVPLWVAVYLRQQQKCRIIPPDWMTVERLTQCKDREESDSSCTDPPHRQYMEITTLLLHHAPDDMQNPESIRAIVRDLWDLRIGKLVSSVTGFISSGTSTARVSQLTNLELATLRNFLSNSMDQLSILRQAATANMIDSSLGRTNQSVLDSSSSGQ